MSYSPANPDYSILAGFTGPVARPRTPFLYHCGLVLVAVTMVTLLLLYLALVGLVAYGVFYHAVHHWTLIDTGAETHSGRIMLGMILVYLAPLLLGVILIFFMVKPLFAGPPPEAQPLALNPANEPLLYAFIEKVCDSVGAPSPKRIDLDCHVNAAAGFRRGLFSMFSHDLVLVIGLPLVANLTAGELAGVIAHEFGHFKQGLGMRFSFFIRSVLRWFYRVAYERDAWDVGLERASLQVEDSFALMFLLLVQMVVGLTRLVLKLLLLLGILVSGFMVRQMEYDADACEIKVAGSGTFERTLRKLATLTAAQEVVHNQLRATWKKNRQLPDNLCELLRRAHEHLPAATMQRIDDTLGLDPTSVFDSHPSAADRIRQARIAGEPGIFHDDRPASALFASFDVPARFVTLLHYTDDLGIPITPDMLAHVETAELKSTPAHAAAAAADAAHAYFPDVLPLVLPLKLSAPATAVNYEADAAELERIVAGLQQSAGESAAIASQYAAVSKKLISARAAAGLLSARVPIRPADFGLGEATIESARVAEAEALAALETLRGATLGLRATLARRMDLSFALLLANRGEFGPEPINAARAGQLIGWFNPAGDLYARQFEIMNALGVLDRVTALRDESGETPALSRAIAAQTTVVGGFILPAPAPPVEAPPASGLRIAARPRHVSPAEIEQLRQRTWKWFVDYHGALDELARMAQVAEGVGA